MIDKTREDIVKQWLIKADEDIQVVKYLFEKKRFTLKYNMFSLSTGGRKIFESISNLQ